MIVTSLCRVHSMDEMERLEAALLKGGVPVARQEDWLEIQVPPRLLDKARRIQNEVLPNV